MWWRIGIVLVLCFASIALGSPKPALDNDDHKADLNAAMIAEGIKAAPKIIEDYRKGNPTVERIANTYKMAKELYGDLIKASEYSGKFSRLEVNVVNGLKDETLYYGGAHWDTGRFWVDPLPRDIPPGGMMLALTSNRDWALTGVTGGLKFKIGSRSKPKKCLYVGMTNPLVGEYKHFISVKGCNLSAKYAYDSSIDGDIKFLSEGGYELSAFIRAPKEGAEKRFEYSIVPDGTSDKKSA